MAEPFVASTPAGFKTWSLSGTPSIGIAPTLRSDAGFIWISQNYTDYIESEQQAPRTSGGSGATRSAFNNHAAGNPLMSWLNNAGIEVVRVQCTASETFQLEYWNGSAWVGVGSSAVVDSINVNRWMMDFSGLGTASGSLSLKVADASDDTISLDETGSGLDLTSATNIDRVRQYSTANGTSYTTSEVFIVDGNAQSTFCYLENPNTNGTDTDGTGGEAQIDETTGATYDNDFISLAADGDASSVRSAVRSFGGRTVKGVGFEVRAKRGETGPQTMRPYLKISGTRYYHPDGPIALETTFGGCVFMWELNPATTAAWSNAEAEASTLEFGVEASA